MRASGATLVLLCGFGLSRTPSPSGTLRRIYWQLFTDYFRHNAIRSASPLSLERQCGYVEAFVAQQGCTALDATLCGLPADALPVGFPGARATYRFDGKALPVDPKTYDTVIISYADPLGLGWSSLEKRLAKVAARPPLVLNGRGRILPLTRATRALLRRRRLLARSRIGEMTFGLLAVAAATILACKDTFTRRA